MGSKVYYCRFIVNFHVIIFYEQLCSSVVWLVGLSACRSFARPICQKNGEELHFRARMFVLFIYATDALRAIMLLIKSCTFFFSWELTFQG